MALTKRYSAKELNQMSLKSLGHIGSALGLAFDKHHTKADRVRRILAAYTDLDLADDSHTASPSTPADDLAEPSSDFERLIQSGAQDGAGTAAPRGGARPGAGRPAGMTNELGRLTHLSSVPHPMVKSVLAGMFQTWATAAKCPEICLTEAEAVELALPWTQTLDYMGVTQRIPPWLHLGVMTLWTTVAMVKSKARLAREAAARRKQEAAAPNG